MASRLILKPPSLRHVRRLSSSPFTPDPAAAAGGEAFGGGAGGQTSIGDGSARPPSPFSDIKDRHGVGVASVGDGAARPRSPFSDIKDRLRSGPTPPRRLSDLPSPPPPLSPSSPTPLVDIRKHLAEFRSKSPRPPSAAPPTLSFQQLFKNNLLNNNNSNPSPSPAAPPPNTLSFDSIRDSLRKLPPAPPPTTSPFPGFRNLRPPPSPGSSFETLPDSIIDKKDDGPKAPKTEFLRMYSYDELGEKLRRLRPQGETATATEGPFSLAELNNRLVKLRELEEKEADSRMGGVSFRDLRDSLVRLKHVDAEKKATLNKLSILTNLSGLPTPAFMLKDPQEELFERYNHPDHMSSAEKMKLELQKVRDEFKMSESDCGSTRVQVAQLTTKIKHLSSTLHKKDKHSRKGLQEMIQTRKKLLKYLRRTDWDSYCLTLSKLGLRDTPEYKAPHYKAKAETKSKKKSKSKSKSKSKTKIKT